MKFFIDTGNLAQIKEANELGILDGVTTNPSLMAQVGVKGKLPLLRITKQFVISWTEILAQKYYLPILLPWWKKEKN